MVSDIWNDFRYRLRALFQRARVEQELADELRFHLEHEADRHERAGVPRSEAWRRACIAFGGVEAVKERSRDGRGTAMLETCIRDLRFALRTLARRPSFALAVVLTLAIGIGAATAVSSVLDALLLHPWYYPNADRIVEIRVAMPHANRATIPMNPNRDVLAHLSDTENIFEMIEPIPATSIGVLIGQGAPEVLEAVHVRPTFFGFTGRPLLLGRGFDSTDTQLGAAPTVILNERLWRDRFGGDPHIIDRRFLIDGEPRTVIGVASSGLHVPGEPAGGISVWLPFQERVASTDELIVPVRVIGRLRPGVATTTAQRELDGILHSLPGFASAHLELTPVWQLVRLRTSIELLTVAVGLVLLLACGNVGHLLLARGLGRERELSIRVAIGATEARLWAQLVVESLLLISASCILGLIMGDLALHLALALRPPALSELDAVRLSGGVLYTALASSLVVGIAFGSFQALRIPHRSTTMSLASTIGGGTGKNASLRGIIIVEVATAFLVIYAASSLINAMSALQHADTGMRPSGLLSLRIAMMPGGDPPSSQFMDGLAARARMLPGVLEVTIALRTPPDVGPVQLGSTIQLEDGEVSADAVPRLAYNRVAPGFFHVAGMHMIAGQRFTDTTQSSQEVIVSASTARRLWPNGRAIGARLRLRAGGPWLTVAGIVADVAAGGLAPESREPVVYMPLANHHVSTLLIRTSDGATSVPTALRKLAATMDTSRPLPTVKSLDDAFAETIARPLFASRVLAAFAEICLILAGLGIYGVLSHAVAQRTRDIGIRLALGGQPRVVARSIVLNAVKPALIGLVIGLAGIPFIERLLAAIASQAGHTTFSAFLISIVLLLTVAAIGAAVPAWRAAHVDPMATIRTE